MYMIFNRNRLRDRLDDSTLRLLTETEIEWVAGGSGSYGGGSGGYGDEIVVVGKRMKKNPVFNYWFFVDDGDNGYGFNFEDIDSASYGGFIPAVAGDTINPVEAMNKANQIAAEELERTRNTAPPGGGHNDIYDAERHARWVYRMCQEIGSTWAHAIAYAHELEGRAMGQPESEFDMDMHNNGIGYQAYMNGSGIPNINTPGLRTIQSGGGSYPPLGGS